VQGPLEEKQPDTLSRCRQGARTKNQTPQAGINNKNGKTTSGAFRCGWPAPSDASVRRRSAPERPRGPAKHLACLREGDRAHERRAEGRRGFVRLVPHNTAGAVALLCAEWAAQTLKHAVRNTHGRIVFCLFSGAASARFIPRKAAKNKDGKYCRRSSCVHSLFASKGATVCHLSAKAGQLKRLCNHLRI